MDLLETHLLKKSIDGQVDFTLGTLFSVLLYVFRVFLGIIELSAKAIIFLAKSLAKLVNLAYRKVQFQLK